MIVPLAKVSVPPSVTDSKPTETEEPETTLSVPLKTAPSTIFSVRLVFSPDIVINSSASTLVSSVSVAVSPLASSNAFFSASSGVPYSPVL